MKYLPPPCKGGCGRGVRPYKSDKEEWGNALVDAARGYCFKCYKGVPKVYGKTPDECTNCDCKLRPRKGTLDEYPLTREHHGRGLCSLCWKRDKRGVLDNGKPIATPEETARKFTRHHPEPAKVEKLPDVTDPGLLRLRAEREARKARQERAQRVRVQQEAVQRRFIQSRRAA